MTDIVTMTFVNRDAEETDEVKVEASSAPLIAQWYGSYCAGDDYDILIDGEIVDKDINGRIG